MSRHSSDPPTDIYHFIPIYFIPISQIFQSQIFQTLTLKFQVEITDMLVFDRNYWILEGRDLDLSIRTTKCYVCRSMSKYIHKIWKLVEY